VLAPILAHHDDRRRWSLRSVAPLVNGACGHCQRGLPKALLIHMEMGGSVGLCPECGDYLYLDDRSLGVVQ
jgi:predicted  nucleic acid-binding Zn-ribbon protein